MRHTFDFGPVLATTVSVIVPVYHEGEQLAAVAAHLRRQSGILEAIVVDAGDDAHAGFKWDEPEAGPHDDSGPTVRRVVTRSRGRAVQMNLGAGLSRGSVLLFLHADTRLPPGSPERVAEAVAAGSVWGRFDVRLDAPDRVFRVIEWAMNTRSAVSGIATGDQAMFVTRQAFDRVGGFPEIPLMEDIALSRRLKRLGAPARIRPPVRTSARRWQGEGVWRTVATMWALRFLFWAGVDPQRLARHYRDTRARDPQ